MITEMLGLSFIASCTAVTAGLFVETESKTRIVLAKLSIADDIVSYSTNDGLTHEFDALEFLAQLSCHVPKPYESMTRYYGYYSCRARGERRKQALTTAAADQPLPEPTTKPSATWAACIKRIYEINPLQCPRCKGTMRIIAFLTNEQTILEISDSLGLPRAQAPPKIPPKPQPEFFDEIPPDDFN